MGQERDRKGSCFLPASLLSISTLPFRLHACGGKKLFFNSWRPLTNLTRPPRRRRAGIETGIAYLHRQKSPGYDRITGKILKELPIIGTKYLNQLFNAIVLLYYFRTQWKVAQINLILKPGKPPHALPPTDQTL
jgi:hypothetical protein